MNKIFLLTGVAVLALGASESWATTSCPEGQTCTQIGDDCFVYFTDVDTGMGEQIATIIGTGDMWNAVYDYGNRGYAYYYGDTKNPFYGNNGILSVKFAEDSNITSIGNNAFNSAYDLKSITIPDSVTSIGNGAFSYTDLKSINCSGTEETCNALWNNLLKDRTDLNSNISFNIIPPSTGDSGNGSGSGSGESGGTGDSVNTTCPDGYEWREGEGCVDKYPYSKKHWTPAEVNQWLYDDNNTITLTFKKQ